MLINTERIISITKLQKELTKRLSKISKDGEPIYVFKNSEMEAVILSPEEYEYLNSLNEIFEYHEISNVVKERLKNYDRSQNVKWEELRK